jgi:hypothetical protein
MAMNFGDREETILSEAMLCCANGWGGGEALHILGVEKRKLRRAAAKKAKQVSRGYRFENRM